MRVEMKQTKKDYYTLMINGKEIIKNNERSNFRHIIEVIDNKINVGI